MTTIAERSGVLFPTAVVGSLPRPDYVRQIVVDGSGGDDGPRYLDTAVAHAVALQESAGLDVISDGEWRRASYIGIIAELASGFALEIADDGRPWTVVVDEVHSEREGAVVGEVERLKGITDRLIKVALPSPALLAERMWDAERSSHAYTTGRDFAEAVTPILRREAELLSAAGADVIQIDDPHLCLMVDPEVRNYYDDEEEPAGTEPHP